MLSNRHSNRLGSPPNLPDQAREIKRGDSCHVRAHVLPVVSEEQSTASFRRMIPASHVVDSEQLPSPTSGQPVRDIYIYICMYLLTHNLWHCIYLHLYIDGYTCSTVKHVEVGFFCECII